mgnify:CR=1 FL=1
MEVGDVLVSRESLVDLAQLLSLELVVLEECQDVNGRLLYPNDHLLALPWRVVGDVLEAQPAYVAVDLLVLEVLDNHDLVEVFT